MSDPITRPGRLRPAPENFLSAEQISEVKAGRRDFLRNSLLAANRHYRVDALRFQARPESSLEALEEEFMQLNAQAYSEKR